ncbi:hypothetical protein NBZ79_02395 [Sneathiella marina]|uniref:BZIP domain-containing protein n=1 Tax=Sneathiella marina TaxID=2950108 RepID=A0ABY4W4C3_9PROT|nr:hypothetical protein [Sneathiella marina]USG61822.1 hypothetical protein NBZ79_02395 [Sneathiella marina]
MSFARHNPGRSLYGHTDISSVRERELLAENNLLRDKNRRLSDAILTLVDHIETKLPSLEAPKSVADEKPNKTERTFKDQRPFQEEPKYKKHKPKKVEILETFQEPIEFAEPAPEMQFSKRKKCSSKAEASKPSDYKVSPDLAPEEIDLLKSPTQERFRGSKLKRETVDVVDLEPGRDEATEHSDFYKAGSVYSSDVPNFDFSDDEPVIDIEFKRKETLRAAMRRRVNRLRW